MIKGDKGKKIWGLIVILAIIVSVFGGAVSAEDLSGEVTQSVTDVEIETEVDNLSSGELTEALDAVMDDSVNIEFADQSSRSSYDRQAAYNYAYEYWDEVCSDGYFWNTPTGYISLSPGTNIEGWTGYDCAHFVSCCIGSESNEQGGGLPVPEEYPSGPYGIPSSTRLYNWLIDSGNAVEVYSLAQLEKGDVISYDLNENGYPDHTVLYLGNGKIAAHTACYWYVNWDIYNPSTGYYKFVHIKGDTAQPDLVVEDIWVEPAEFGPSDAVKICTKIKNVGMADAVGTFHIRRYFDGVSFSYTSKNGLGAGHDSLYCKDYTWPSDCNLHTIKVVVDVNNVIDEGDNEDNNERSEAFSAICVNQPPIAHASDLSNQPEVMHPDTLYEVTAKYYDPDGRANLGLCTLVLSHPSDDVMMGWGEDLKVPVETSAFINDGDLAVDYTQITDSYEGYQLTWKFKLNDQWPEAENCIDFCVLARDDDDLQSELDCDNTDASFVVNQAPNTPSIPSGPSSGYTGTSYSYSTSATDPDGDQVKYTFDWGDGTTFETGFVNSGTSASKSHSWGSAGTYYVKAKATDSKGASSGWSSSKTVTITTPNNPPNTPSIPSGPSSGYTGTSYSYSTSATDPDGDQVKYTFDWGDGTTSETGFVNSGTSASKSHSWGSAGTYYVKAKATDSKGASSGWSSSKTVTITTPNNPPNTPSIPSGPSSGYTGTSYSYSTSATDPDGNNVYYWFDWGDSTNSGWIGPYPSGTSGSASKEWCDPGTYNVKAKAKDEHGAESSPLWSDSLPVCINGLWEDDPINPCKKRRLSCTGEYEYQNKDDGTICDCTASNTLKRCYSGVCTDTGICDATTCGADAACDGKRPGDSCGGGICNSVCECGATGYGGSVYRDGQWFLRTEDSPLAKVYSFWWGWATDKPVTGNWNGDGKDTIGVYRDGKWYLSNSITTPSVDHSFWWGWSTDTPVTGDWDGDGKDTIGVYRDGRWFLSNSITTPSVDHSFWWGWATDIPVTGDWNGDGEDTIGVYRDGRWYLSNSITTPSVDHSFWWGWATDIPVTGDWDGDGEDTIGVYRDGRWYLSNSITTPSVDHSFWWGWATDEPVTGHWS